MTLEHPDVAKILLPAMPVHVHPIELAGIAGASAVEPTAHKNAGANPRSESDENEIVDAPGHAAPVLADGRHVGVVFEHYRNPVRLAQIAAQVNVFPARKVVGERDQPAFGINRARHSDGYRKEFFRRARTVVPEAAPGMGGVWF